MCYVLTALVRDVTNFPIRNKTEMTTIFQDVAYRYIPISFILSVINLWNSLDNETRNTRTFDTFKINLQRKVVLSKIPGNVLVCDRRSNNLYASLRHNYSSLKYYLFRSNIVTYHILADD